MILYLTIVIVVSFLFVGFYFRYNPIDGAKIVDIELDGFFKFLKSDVFLWIALIISAVLTLIFCIIEITGDFDDENTESGINILSILGTVLQRIVGFVLSHGVYCEVLEPEWLKQEVKETAEKILKKY